MGHVAASQKQHKCDEAHKAQKCIQEAITEYRCQEKLNPAAKLNMSAITWDFDVSYASFWHDGNHQIPVPQTMLHKDSVIYMRINRQSKHENILTCYPQV
jgi:hypothetical protein